MVNASDHLQALTNLQPSKPANLLRLLPCPLDPLAKPAYTARNRNHFDVAAVLCVCKEQGMTMHSSAGHYGDVPTDPEALIAHKLRGQTTSYI